ncbi:MAG: hypothetical protein GX136_09065 [Clostridiales bacterium]|jgi:hypothetical protein|nr:hypothetical protein [Clostridiales bacterium]
MKSTIRCLAVFMLVGLLFMSVGCSRSVDSSDTDSMNKRIKELLDNNIECVDIFSIGFLPIDDTVIEDEEGREMQRVTSDRFRTFNDLKEFITNTYVRRVR